MDDPQPVRLRLSRAKDFNLQALSLATNGLPAVKVDRTTEFGNPFPIAKGTFTSCGVSTYAWQVGTWEGGLAMWIADSEAEARKLSVDAFKSWVNLPQQSLLCDRARLALRRRNLACWCALPEPGEPDVCHAAVWLNVANRPTCEAA